jgi:hypothetical protein
VKTENLAEHTMHSEWYDVPEATRQAMAACRARGGRVVAVGTTTVRTLESWARSCTGADLSGGQMQGDTTIFITPGFRFQVVDALLTNFHLPKSTLMMLVSAFAGYEHVMALYRHAIAQRYRFFSYGDAMWLTRGRANPHNPPHADLRPARHRPRQPRPPRPLTLNHGVVQTPIFMPVGTYGTVKGVMPRSLEDMGAQIILGNTFHLWMRPGLDVMRQFGGLHRFEAGQAHPDRQRRLPGLEPG